ncbi:MAG: LemA family protein [Candidatus Saccharibacteria bacterium]|nr:LemA family protein [Candidatus Saccharibacteria bacterium]
MSAGIVILLVAIGLVVILAIYILGLYNTLVRTNERVDEAWSDITVQLKYRADLIPNLVETVKGYAKHETAAIKEVSEARAKMMGAKSVKSTAEADQSLTGALSRLMAISEAYPELKANENFKQLMSQLGDTEDKIQAARRFYNAGVKEINAKIKMFPANILFHRFKTREYYEVAESEKAKIEKAPEVSF